MDNNITDIYSLDFMEEIIKPINSKQYKTKELAEHYNVSLAVLKQYIKDKGFRWVGSTYVKDGKDITKIKKTVDIITAPGSTTERKKFTCNINAEVYKLIKLQALIEDVDMVEVVEKAINNYVSSTAKEMLQQIEATK